MSYKACTWSKAIAWIQTKIEKLILAHKNYIFILEITIGSIGPVAGSCHAMPCHAMLFDNCLQWPIQPTIYKEI